jgi:hypothetical protein
MIPFCPQPLLAAVVDQQAVCAKPDSRRPAVGGQPAVMHEMTDRDAAGDLSEVSDKPPMAAPPGAFAAHHRLLPGTGRGEQFIDGGQEVRLPHVAGVTPEGRLLPCHIG